MMQHKPRDGKRNAERRRQIVKLCDARPYRKAELCQELGLKVTTLDHITYRMAELEMIVPLRVAFEGRTTAVWVTPRLRDEQCGHLVRAGHASKKQEKKLPTPVVTGTSHAAKWSSAPVIVRGNMTTQAAPKGRFEPDPMVAGAGAISQDWAARLDGKHVDTRLPGYVR
jgi:hypothetical protein